MRKSSGIKSQSRKRSSRSSRDLSEKLRRVPAGSEPAVAVAVAEDEDAHNFISSGDTDTLIMDKASLEETAEHEDDCIENKKDEDNETPLFPEERSANEDLLRLYFKDIGKIPLLPEEEVTRLAKLIEKAEKKKDKSTVTKAKKKLVSANLRLVISIAKKFSNCGMPLLDLIQAGNIGLMKAVDGFNYKLGFKFSTYASKWIQAAITRTISNQVRTIRIPVNVIPALKKVDRVNRKLSRELGREPTTIEISEGTGVAIEKISSMARIPQRAISLDFPIDGDNGDCKLSEILGDTNSPSTVDIVNKQFFRDELQIVMQEALDPREQEVLRLRYGLEDGTEHTQSEIAVYLNLSRQRVSQIENRALLRLRNHMGNQSLRNFLN